MRANLCIAAIVLLASFALADRADAGVLACKRHSISTADQRQLQEAAARALPALEIDWSSATYCEAHTYTYAWFRTKPIEQNDRTQLLTSAACTRGRGVWTCETTPQRTMIAETFSPPYPLAYIPTDMEVSAARSVVTQAFVIVSGARAPAAGPHCTETSGFDQLQSAFLDEGGDLSLERYSQNESQTLRVSRNDSFIDFDVIHTPSGDRYAYRCWSLGIVVD
jgi:hypothetical protein